MKRGLSLVLSILLILGIITNLPLTVFAGNIENFTFTLNDDGASYEVSDFDESVSGDIVIPDTYNGLPVTEIGFDAFNACTRITSITIPANITRIPYDSFYSCDSLISINVDSENNNYYSIDGVLFSPLYGVEIYPKGKTDSEYVIPNGVERINDSAFYDCDNLLSVKIPDSVYDIRDEAFAECDNLISVKLGRNISSIGYEAFYDCSSLTSINLPNTVVGIEERVFLNCKNLNSITVSENNTTYSSLDGVLFNKDKTELLQYPMGKKDNGYTIPDGVTSINSLAFSNCTNLISITIPDSVTSIGQEAFAECTKLSSVYITDIGAWCNISFNNNPLYYADNLYINGELASDVIVPYGVTTVPYYAFSCTNLTSITLPDSVTSIGSYAFYGCTNLTSITLPGSVTSMGQYAFKGCTNLNSLYVTDIGAWCNIRFNGYASNPLYYADSLYINRELATDVIVPYGVTAIPYYAFSCTNLTSITLPDSVTSIADYTFYSCTNLETIKIPDSVTNIGKYSFYYCKGLSRVDIGKGVTSIGSNVFEHCDSLKSINVSESNIAYTSVDGVLFDKNKTELVQYPANKSSSEYIVPDTVTNIGAYSFFASSNLKTITIPDSVTNIGKYSFYYCKGLSRVDIGKGVTSIGSNVFEHCDSLKSINVSESNIAYTSVDGVLFDKNKTELVQYPANKSSSEYIVPDTVTNIGAYSFFASSNLKTITIPDSVTNIGKYAFYYCSKLKKVYYMGTEEEWENINVGSNNDSLLQANIEYINPGVSGDFKIADGSKFKKFNYSYNDSFFNNKATKYNHELATMSLSLALSSYQSEDALVTYGNVKQLLDECGFLSVYGKAYNYTYKTTSDDVGCYISRKKIGNETVIAIVVRSGGYDKEWASNLTIGLTGDHQGFDEASDIVLKRIKSYIKENEISGDVKFWITGYSRGAATATQTAAKLNFATIDGVNFTKEQIYAYGFATPAGAIKGSDPTNTEKYGNIFNIINFHDIVPKVAPEGWNFTRYGKTFYLPFSDSSDKSISKENAVKKWFSEHGLTYKLDEFVSYYWEAGDGKLLSFSNDSLGVFSTKLISTIANSIASRAVYVASLQSSIRSIWTHKPTISLRVALIEILDVLIKELSLTPQYVTTAISANSLLIEAHDICGAYYLGWMQTMPKNLTEKEYKQQGYFTTGSLRKLIANCPVDVYVYDIDGNLVAAIENDTPVEIEGSTFSYGVDENGQKYFYLPVDAEYNITIKAREDCETTCTINEFSADSFTENRILTYTEMQMEKGEEILASTDAYSENDIINGTENGSSADYTVQREDEEVIEADVDITSEEIENYTYNVTVEYDENKGIVYGGGIFTIGQFCQVTAENKPGYRFSKWTVNGETVSTDSTYRFAVKEDVTIVAEYVPCEHPKYLAEVIAPTCTEEGCTKHTCEVCTYSYNDSEVKAYGHFLSDWITDKKATVNAAGSKHKECTECGEILETAVIKQLKCSKPSIKSASNDGKNVKVTWKKVSGADTYYVYRKVKGGSYSYLGKTTKTYYVDKTAKAGKTYTYKLRAKNEAGYSSYSSTKTVKHLDQPTLKTATNTSSGVKITWSKVSKASGYKVYRKTSDGWKYLGKTTKTYFTDKTAKSGKKYTYTVKAYSGDYNSSYSSTGISRYYLADPTLKTPQSTKKGVVLKWNKITGADGYVVYRKTGSGSYKKIATVKGKSKDTYTDKKAKKGKTYTYKIKAYKSKTYSAYSNTNKIKDKY